MLAAAWILATAIAMGPLGIGVPREWLRGTCFGLDDEARDSSSHPTSALAPARQRSW